jgi:hypothetical protein
MKSSTDATDAEPRATTAILAMIGLGGSMYKQTDYGKGGATRPRFVSRELADLNYDLAFGNISRSTYYRRKRKLREQGKIG